MSNVGKIKAKIMERMAQRKQSSQILNHFDNQGGQWSVTWDYSTQKQKEKQTKKWLILAHDGWKHK